MTKEQRNDIVFNRKIRRLQKAFRKGRMCRDIYEQKRSRLVSDYYEKSQKLLNINQMTIVELETD